jgi:4'-phosphopantetheinyl transferase
MDSAEPVPECAGPSVVHVCAFIVSRYVQRLAHVSQWLSREEQERAQRFHRESDRSRFILGRAIVRDLCGVYLGIEPAKVRLDQTPAGKPYLHNPTPAGQNRFDFNVAHSGDCVLVGWTIGRAVGVDVEELDRFSFTLFDDVSTIAFSRAERAALSAAKPGEVTAMFYRIWVRKHSCFGPCLPTSRQPEGFSRSAGQIEYCSS